MNFAWGVAGVLVIWAAISAMRSGAEARSDAGTRTPERPGADPDAIDHAALEQAECEIKDLDVFQQPEEGFRGDDWGPGTGTYGPPIR